MIDLRYSLSAMPLSLLAVCACIILFSCKKEDDYLTDTGVLLTFSTDTLRFDTVFTSVGSATRQIRVSNTADRPIIVERIFLDQDRAFFRMNVDGVSGMQVENIKIPANDSIYIFVEVTIDPDDPLSLSPFVVSEHIRFITNGNEQAIAVEAWGQNANYIPNTSGARSGVAYSCDLSEWVWDDPKPYVIYGILYVDSCTLRIPAGQQVYVHGGLVKRRIDDTTSITYNDGRLIIGPQADLIVEGTVDEPVVFQGDRLESGFDGVPGQWFGILLSSGSESELEHMVLKNSAFGIIADSAAMLELRSSQIFNTINNGLTGIHANIEAVNCLLYDSGGSALRLTQGGQYRFDYCTFATYGNRLASLVLDNAKCLEPDDPFCQQVAIYPLDFRMRNCIIAGTQSDELQLINRSENAADFRYEISHTVLKVKELLSLEGFVNFYDFCDPCHSLSPQDALFVNAAQDNYQLDSLSVANGYAQPLPTISTDLLEVLRDAAKPDAGALELQ